MRKLAIGLMAALVGSLLFMGGQSGAQTECPLWTGNDLTGVTGVQYTLAHDDGTTEVVTAGPGGVIPNVRAGDTVTVTFTVPEGCEDEYSLVSYATSAPTFPENLASHSVFDEDTGFFEAGTHTLTVEIPGSTVNGGTGPGCTNPHPEGNPVNNRGANTRGHAYESTCDGSHGNTGGGNASTNRPCDGCVGRADYKNPPGQFPDGTDPNAGYECDRNQGVGQGNPAHSGCRSSAQHFQLDFVRGPVLAQLGPVGSGNLYSEQGRLIHFALG